MMKGKITIFRQTSAAAGLIRFIPAVITSFNLLAILLLPQSNKFCAVQDLEILRLANRFLQWREFSFS